MTLDWNEWKKRIGTRRFAVMLGLLVVGILLFILPQNEKSTVCVLPQRDLKTETEEYHTQLTEEISDLIGTIKGVGEVRLMLTLDGSVEYTYLKEEQENTDGRDEAISRDYSESYLLVTDASGEQTVLAVKRSLPKVIGAAVVCKGGDDVKIRQQIIELLRAVLGVSAADISVLPLA